MTTCQGTDGFTQNATRLIRKLEPQTISRTDLTTVGTLMSASGAAPSPWRLDAVTVDVVDDHARASLLRIGWFCALPDNYRPLGARFPHRELARESLGFHSPNSF
jgi:hypothetical protein